MIKISKKILGNEEILNKLIINYQNNNFPNSIILNGSKGIGKCTFVFNFINNIFNSLSDKFDNSENLIYNNTHPNIKYIAKELDDKNSRYKNFITIEQIRNLQNFLNQSSFNNTPKFIVIDSADDLNINSANALLKSLEEPKNNTFFILISHQISKIIPTVRSRCVIFNIQKPSKKLFYEILTSDTNIDQENINFLYNLSDGSPGLALKLNSDKIENLHKIIINVLLNNNSLSDELLSLSNIVDSLTNDEFRIFLMLIRYILISLIKINLGIENMEIIFKPFLQKNNIKNVNNLELLNILDFLNKNEENLFIYNLDKKIFCLNIFNPHEHIYE